MSVIAWASVAAWLVVIVAGGLLRSRAYAMFRGVVLGLHTLIAVPLLGHLGALLPLGLYLHAATYLDSLLLIRPSLRPMWYRVLVSWPAQYMAAATLLAFPWAIVAGLGFYPHGFWLPYVVALFGMVQSLRAPVEYRSLVVGKVPALERVERVAFELQTARKAADVVPKPPALATFAVDAASGSAAPAPLRIAQITDPHLGPFMPVFRLRRICERVVAEQPDLVLLTGDYLTMESQRDEAWLSEALAPLAALNGRVFACLGNHDHEAPRTVRRALQSIGATLLVDDAAVVTTPVGPVQIIGFDFHFERRKERMATVCLEHPRLQGVLRLALLHDPGAFRHLPAGEVDLVLAGHTHGGQVGLLSLGSMWTVAGWVAKIPDHGLWGFGTSRLYVHRGTGHYGYPLRLGVPAEESILHVYHQPVQG